MILEASGSTYTDLFTQAGRTLLSLLTSADDVSPALREKILIEASSPLLLAQQWVETLLSLASDQHFLFMDFPSLQVIPKNGGWRLDALAVGELVDSHRHVFPQALSSLKVHNVTLQEAEGLFRLRCELHLL